MKTYEILKVHNPAYSYLILSTSYLSPLDDIDDIEYDLKETSKVKVLFDMLLTNGISSNRFIEAEFNGGKFEISSFRPLQAVDLSLKTESLNFYRDNSYLLDDSILPRSHQFLIKKGRVI